MQLSTQIVAESSASLLKSLSACFDHQFSLLLPSCSSEEGPGQQVPQWMASALSFSNCQQESAECIVCYNLEFSPPAIQAVLSALEGSWQCEVVEYDIKSGSARSSTVLPQQSRTSQALGGVAVVPCCLYSLEMTVGSARKWVYFVAGVQEESVPGSCSRQMVKILHFLRTYLSLEEHLEEQITFQDHLSARLNCFLHENRVDKVSILVGAREGEVLDQRILQQVGHLNVPEAWREKSHYREIKRQVHSLRHKEDFLLKHLRTIKSQVVQTINELRQLVGFPEVKYPEIEVEVLKELKRQCFSEKVASINDLDQCLEGTNLRLQQLHLRREELLGHKRSVQQQQVAELLLLKNQVVSLQNCQLTAPTRCIFKRESKPQLQKQLLTTMFSRAQKQDARPPSPLLTPSSSHRKASLKEEKGGFRTAEKKVAAVVKDGGSARLNIAKLREEYEAEVLGVDFEVEKQGQAWQATCQKGAALLRNLLEGNDCHQFFND